MTIKELYEKAVEESKEDYNIELQYQDGGGCYYGHTTMADIDYDDNKHEVILA